MTREEAVKWLESLKQEIGKTKNCSLWHYAEAIDMVIEVMSEPKTGKWVDIDNYYRMATCSRCHKVTMFEKWGEYTKPYHYCPNCGARMKGGAE